MIIFRIVLIQLCLASTIFAVLRYDLKENQELTLRALWAACRKKCFTMELNKVYAFRVKNEDKLNTHTRLIVGHIWKPDVDDDNQRWDFEAYYFDMRATGKRYTDRFWGAKCFPEANTWECKEGNVFKFAGEVGMGVDVEYFHDVEEIIGEEAAILIGKNDCYNLAWNNCAIFAKNLAKRIEKKPEVIPEPGEPLDQPFDLPQVAERFVID